VKSSYLKIGSPSCHQERKEMLASFEFRTFQKVRKSGWYPLSQRLRFRYAFWQLSEIWVPSYGMGHIRQNKSPQSLANLFQLHAYVVLDQILCFEQKRN